jgi:hypothetical protein
MVYQYTLGDDFKSNSEKKQLQKQTIEDYKNFSLNADKKNRAMTIKYTYPFLSTGVINSLVQTGANNDQIKQAAVEQIQINAAKNKNFTKTPPEYADIIKNEEDENGFFGGVKRSIRFAFDVWNHTQEQVILRGQRGRILFTKEVEEDLQKQGLTSKEAQRVAGIFTSNLLPFPAASTERKAIANGLGRLIARKDFGISENFIGEVGAKKIAGYYEQAGPSSLEYTLRKVSEEAALNPDDYIKNIPKAFGRLGVGGVVDKYDELTGTGFIPAGEAEEITSEIKEANKYNDRSITTGRYIENQLGIQGDEGFNIVSGTIDAAILILTDPAALIGKTAKAIKAAKTGIPSQNIKQARRIQERIKDAVKEGNISDAKTLANDFINQDMGKDVANIILEDKSPDKFIKLLDANKDPAYALKLFDAESTDDVINAASDAILNGTSWKVPTINRTKIIPDWLNDYTYKTFGQKRAAAKADDPLSKIGRYIPENEVNLQDWQQTVNTLISHGTVGKLPRKDLNDIAVRVTRALVDEDYRKAQDILADDYYGKLIEKLADKPETVSSFKAHQNKMRGFRDNNVLYSIDQQAYKAGEGLKPITTGMQKSTKVGDTSINLQTPFPDQIMDRTFYFTDHRDLRRAVKNVDGIVAKSFAKVSDSFNADTPLGKFFAQADVTAKDVLGKASDAYSDKIIDKVWTFQRAWSTANLPFRFAYPLRLVLEGQPRMAAFGLDSVVNNPKSYFEYLTILDEDVLGNKFVQNAWSKNNRQLQQQLDKAVGNAAGKHFGPAAIRGFVKENFSEFTLGNGELDNLDKVKRFAEGIRIQLAGIWREDIAQNIADYTVNAKSLDELAERMWNGDLKDVRLNYEKALDRVERPTSIEGVKEFINGYKQRINELTGGDIELLESIATGKYKGIDVRSWDRRKTDNVKVIMNGIENMLKTSRNRPFAIPAPDDLINAETFKKYKKTQRDDTPFSSLWFIAGAIEANINRIPAYKQLYFRSVADDLIQADDKALKTLLQRIDKLPKAVKKELTELYPDIEKLGSKINKNNLPKLSLEQIDSRAQLFALEEHNRILYNLSQKGLVADGLRFVFPFFEAYKEVLTSWGKALAINPKYAHRAEMSITAGRRSGIIYKDPLSDEDMMSFPLPDFLANRLLGGNEGEKLRADVQIPLSGLNLISVSLLPGIGPVLAVPIGGVSKKVRETIGRDMFRTIFPFGTPIEEVADLSNPTWFAEVILPSYLKSAIAALNVTKESPESFISQDAIASRLNDSAKVIGLSKVRPMQNKEDLAAFDDAVIENTKFRLMLEAGLKFISPAPPRILFSAEVKKDNAMQLLEAVVGDTDLGKISVDERKTMVSFGVLTAFYSQLQQEYKEKYGIEEGEEVAWLVFNRMIGTDKSGQYNIFGNALLKKGKYQQTEGKQARFENEVKFKDENKELLSKYPLTGIYLTPEIDDEGDLDDTAFFESLENDSIEAIDPLVFAIEAQEFLYSMTTDVQLKQLRGDNSVEARKLKRQIKNDAAEMFPLGVPGDKGINFDVVADREVRPKKPSDFTAKINELKEMAMDKSLVDVSDQWTAINNYMALRELAITKIADSEDYVYPDDMILLERKLKTGTTDLNQVMREQLRSAAQEIGQQYPEFLVLYDELLKYEIQFNKED